MNLDDLDAARRAEHERIETDATDAAVADASYWRALRALGVPRLLAAVLTVRRAGQSMVVANFAVGGGEAEVDA